jgi:hypothetical protein
MKKSQQLCSAFFHGEGKDDEPYMVRAPRRHAQEFIPSTVTAFCFSNYPISASAYSRLAKTSASTLFAPALRKDLAAADRVAPVVTTSSISKILRPVTKPGLETA